MNTESQSNSIPDLTACHREPIHQPGSIQPHGVMIVADALSLRVTHVSANFARSTGMTSQSALDAPLADLLGSEAMVQVRKALTSERYASTNVMTLNLCFPREPQRNVGVHSHGGRIFLELEPASSATDHEHVMSRVQSILVKLRQATSVSVLCDRTAEALRSLTGYDRVMVYQFDAEGHGEVIAEDRRADLTPYLHLRYPASDIPAQARRLYLKHRVRVIVDVEYQPVAMLSKSDEGAHPLDMSYCGLRSVSPTHIEYLHNMGVGATLAISLIQDDKLWGMVVCHHLTPHPVPSDVRSSCDLIGQLVMLLIGRVSETEEFARVVERYELMATFKRSIEQSCSVLAGVAPLSTILMQLVAATGVGLRLNGQLHLFGSTPTAIETQAILDELSAVADHEVLSIDALGSRCPQHASLADVASGVLFLPILNNAGDAIVWFRPELPRTILWGGDPQKAVDLDSKDGRISPRKSFAAWRELLRGTASPWTNTDIRAAQDLRRVITAGMLHHAEAGLIRLSSTDPLTGLANRRQLEHALEAWASASDRPPAVLLFIDLDRFKTVNDSLGHAAGDELLIQVAQRLLRVVPAECLVARLGGDEFVAFGAGEVSRNAEEIAADLIRSFDAPFNVLGRAHHASGSIGIAHSEPAGDNLLREADAAMYASKRQGGGRAVVFENTLHEAALKALRIEQDLFLALQRQEFSLNYQPIVDLQDGSLCGFEALVRWQHPEHGWISPAEFIPRAEESGLIVELGRWVMETAITERARWSDPTLKMSINVSPRQLATSEFVEHLQRTLQTVDIPSHKITIEVTEGALMNEAAVEQLQRIRELGCRIAVDDFGTGYSSLSYLRHLPIDIIKIDRSFVIPLGTDPKADRFFKALVALAHTLNLTVVAEGIETETQRLIVTEAKCDTAQGYLFSKPLSNSDAINYIKDDRFKLLHS